MIFYGSLALNQVIPFFDAQLSLKPDKFKSILKLGGSNI